MSALVSICVDWPAKELWPNRALGRHWAARHGAKDRARIEAWEQASRWRDVFPADAKLAILVQVEPPTSARRDLDNLIAALKPTLDGLSQGLNVDDSRFRRLTVDMLGPVPGGRITISAHLLIDQRGGHA